jgi:hypothetical protein
MLLRLFMLSWCAAPGLRLSGLVGGFCPRAGWPNSVLPAFGLGPRPGWDVLARVTATPSIALLVTLVDVGMDYCRSDDRAVSNSYPVFRDRAAFICLITTLSLQEGRAAACGTLHRREGFFSFCARWGDGRSG